MEEILTSKSFARKSLNEGEERGTGVHKGGKVRFRHCLLEVAALVASPPPSFGSNWLRGVGESGSPYGRREETGQVSVLLLLKTVDGGRRVNPVLSEHTRQKGQGTTANVMAEAATEGTAVRVGMWWVEVATQGSFAPFRDDTPDGDSEGAQASTGSAAANTESPEVQSFSDESEQKESVRVIDGIGDFDAIDFGSLTEEDVRRFEFFDLQAAYDFYNEYGRVKGFSVRRSKVGRSKRVGAGGEILWQIFVCSHEGEREG
ncbi:hypothetical protein PIB30_002926 [Stylosanthes scabra]|uniref:FAR1 domain-containing protein n=1 Tax=Stylosanthes scabra TaxID=79078 RepID=A0ABU6V524_9FABA|nr:hypothetical protein [Stylosanthes scabra]